MNSSDSILRPPLLLAAVEWRDLVTLTPVERAWELTLSLPWLILSLSCYALGWWWLGLACSFYFFLTGLRQSHNAQHYALGLPRAAHDVALFVLSVLMLSSMHAVQVTHMHHHRHCLEEEDTEGATARLAWWRALLLGPLFPIRLHRAAWWRAKCNQRLWIAAELGGISVVLLIVLLMSSLALRWHFGAMMVGECFTGFFAVWTVHRGCKPGDIGRTQRGKWLNWLSYSMFFHVEHHLFPAVPTPHISILATRLDAVTLQFVDRQVLETRMDLRNVESTVFNRLSAITT